MKFFQKTVLTALTLVSAMHAAQAGVIIGGTRVIYDGNKKESSLSVNNPDTVPYLIQSWVEAPDGGAEKAPFIITPPLFRLDKGQQNLMRIVRAGALPENKESMYWLNIKSIPSAERRDNTLQIAVKTRIKIIYRPVALKGETPEEHADKLQWRTSGNEVLVTNSGQYYMNFNEIKVNGAALDDVTYVAPGATAHFHLPNGVSHGSVTFKLINDYGGVGEAHKTSI
ncbi:fimbrial biogenesis chaperone [Cronobacter turicensis]|uniref:fimbrial biogenesis chaperone n=1 Tax=Cronobacter turicensis TaxID=413502 RepID=UPI0024AF70D2|nr:fimbria/pilus periplasmic chaperone [Cronobacter turicensis]MDI7419431.1 fimbria/pilus periplasmic chaperone [Cronobacter turicensis]MDI7498307.1 fimbria/pilus periplasmic chaperone [Cronobacter turicensis]